MWSLKAAVLVGFAALSSARLTTCRSPGEGGTEPNPAKTEAVDVTLAGVDTSALTTREKSEWSRYVSDFLSPCPDQPVSLAQCVKEARACRSCAPAAKFLVSLSRRGLVRQQVEAAYKARFAPESVRNLDLTGSPSKGPSNAKVVIAEWADFECPACGAARPILEEAMKKNASEVRMVFKHFPLNLHPHAEKAARAAVAAQKQNKFWEMYGSLFDHQQNLEPDAVEGYAKELGLDLKRFLQDRDSEATADAVARDRKQGEALGLKSTPSIFINGRSFVSSGEFATDLEDWVKLEIELVSSGAAPAPAAAADAPAKPAPSGSAASSGQKPSPALN